ncbi:MAG TPA: hypothetical protein VKI65_07985 [Gemmataceae bacterium]|nr:hypothetical protein [Gemmataceae bacterium]
MSEFDDLVRSNSGTVPKRAAATGLDRGHVRRTTAKTAFRIANGYCVRHYAPAFCGGAPHHLSLPNTDVWIVPVVLTSPGYGVVGEVGMIVIDAKSQEVLGATSRAAVFASGQRLDKEKRHELEAAFHRARERHPAC